MSPKRQGLDPQKGAGYFDLPEDTQPAGAQPGQPDYSRLDEGNIRATGVGLKQGELNALAEIGEELGALMGTEPAARNAIMREVIRMFLESYLRGDVTVQDLAERFQVPPKPKLKRRG